VEGPTAYHRSAVRFSGWDQRIAVGAPATEADPTPWLDEQAVDEARAGVAPLAPADLPAGIELLDLRAIRAADAAAWGQPCGQLELVYGPGARASSRSGATLDDRLGVVLIPAGCAVAADPTPFATGVLGPQPSRTLGDVTQVRIDQTVVQITTDLSGDELAALVASIGPFDLDGELRRVSMIAERAWNLSAIPADPTAPSALTDPAD
jgi:hypothetical protein